MESKHIHARINSCARTMPRLFADTLSSGKPADRIIASFFRENKSFGSKDRELLRTSLFSAFRWWGLIECLLSPGYVSLLREKDPANSEIPRSVEPQAFDRNSSLFLYASIFMDYEDDKYQILEFLARKTGLPGIDGRTILAKDYISRAKYLIDVFPGRRPERIPLPDIFVPQWFRPHIMDGISFEDLIPWFQKRPPMWLRAKHEFIGETIEELKRNNLRVSQSDKIANALKVDNPKVNLYTLESFRKGYFEVQDIASQSIGIVCGAKPGERWWDACAGAGGKTLQLASMMDGKGRIVSSDIREFKLVDLMKRARRAGMHNISTSFWDGKPLRKSKHRNFDGVLLDAPCSCSGTWRRNPDAKWTTGGDEMKELSELQLRLLTSACDAVRDGGTIVYATCSFMKDENIVNIRKFLESRKDFSLDTFTNPISGKKEEGFTMITPWLADSDMTFVARMKRI